MTDPMLPDPSRIMTTPTTRLFALLVAGALAPFGVVVGAGCAGDEPALQGPERPSRGSGGDDAGRPGRVPPGGAPDADDIEDTGDAGSPGSDTTSDSGPDPGDGTSDTTTPADTTSDGDGSLDTNDGPITTCVNGETRPCSTACGEGVESCVGGAFLNCSARQPAPAEICGDGIDNDCNGQVDEGCSTGPGSCTEGETQSCFDGIPAFEGIGACQRGERTCTGGSFGPCVGSGFPTPEICDGIDNNCNGAIDENVARACSNACGSGNERCTAGSWGACDAPTPGGEEICGDGIDNNCNGQIDEGCPDPCARPFTRVGLYRADADGYEGIRQAAVAAGLTVTQNSLVGRDDFDNFDFILTRVNFFDAGTGATSDYARDLQRWVQNGGRLVVWGAAILSPCTMSAPYTNLLPLRFNCGTTYTGGISLESHPVNSLMTAANAPFVNGYAVEVVAGGGGAATARGSSGGTQWTAGAAATVGCGKVLFWGSDTVATASGFPAANDFWRSVFAWLKAR